MSPLNENLAELSSMVVTLAISTTNDSRELVLLALLVSYMVQYDSEYLRAGPCEVHPLTAGGIGGNALKAVDLIHVMLSEIR